MTLPGEFARYTQGFALPDTNGNVVGNCSVSSAGAPVLTCTLTDFVNGKVDVAGTLWFLATLDGSTDEEGLSFDVDGVAIYVPIPGGVKPSTPGTGGNPPSPFNPGNPSKTSSQNQSGTITWTVTFPGNQVGNSDVVISDVLTPQGADTQTHYNVDGVITVQHRAPGLNEDGSATSWHTLPGWSGGWNDAGTSYSITIPAELIDSTYGYRIRYNTVPSDTAYTGDKFASTANVAGKTLTRTQPWTVTGGGTGSGADLGTVNITKLGDDLPEDVTYTVEYSADNFATVERLTFSGGETVYTKRYRDGIVLQFREVDLPQVDGGIWGDPVWSSRSVEVQAGESIAITLTNSISYPTPSIDIEKWDLDPIAGDRDVVEEAAKLDALTEHPINFTITNTGDEPLVNVEVSDKLTDGMGEITDLVCEFPDGTTGVAWDGPFAVGDSFECTGTLPALDWDTTHADLASVIGFGQFTGKKVTDDDPWHAVTPERPVPNISIIKGDVDEEGNFQNDANTPDDAVELTDGTAELIMIVVNDGNEPLVDVVVSDVVIEGGVVENLVCTFPDSTTGVTWDGPFAVGDSFECTATLTGVEPDTTHENVATVTGVGQFTGDIVTDNDPYHGYRDELPPVEPTPEPTPSEEPTPTSPTQSPDIPGSFSPNKPSRLPFTGVNLAGGIVGVTALILGIIGVTIANKRKDSI